MTSLRILTRKQLDEFHRDGLLVVPDIYTAAEMDAALAATELITYGKPYAEWAADVAAGRENRQIADGIGRKDNPGRPQFPTGVEALDRLLEKPAYLDLVCDVLGTDQLHYINGHLFVRAGPTDKRHSEHPWQGFHFDHDTGSFLPPWNEPGRFDYLGCGVLLHDIDASCAPTVMIPGSHALAPKLMPKWVEDGLCEPTGSFPDIRKVPELSRRSTFTGKKGSVGVSSSYLVHAAVPFQDKSRQRANWTFSVGRAKDAQHNRFGNAYAYDERRFTIPFFSSTTPRVRSIFGWPAPGHAYYTPETLRLLAKQYPAMDLAPYRAAMAGEPSSEARTKAGSRASQA